jgi:hypothetical protein
MLSAEARSNLAASGLEDTTIALGGFEDVPAAVGEGPAYRIPYFDVNGNPISFNRTRLLGPEASHKYKQAANSQNHAYLPPLLPEGWQRDTSQAVIVTEGEKKALAAAQAGLVCIGFGGVDSWRTSRVVVPTESIVSRPTEKRRVTVLELGDSDARALEHHVAPELLTVRWDNRHVLIAYDLPDIWYNENIQGAAFRLASWLRTMGAIPHLWEPAIDASLGKIGLDDYLLEFGVDDTLTNVEQWLAPIPPNMREWVRSQLNQRQNREVQEEVAAAVTSWLDRNGTRYQHLGQSFYFEQATKTLHGFSWDDREKLRYKSFGKILYNIGLKGNDAGVRDRLADAYTGEQPVYEIDPYNTIATTENAIYLQTSNGRMARVEADGITLMDNGEDDILFSSNEAASLDEDRLQAEIRQIEDNWDDMPLRWYDAFDSVYLEERPPYTIEQTKTLFTCLFYMSPWIQRWRGLQLPIELAIAEPGSGKTFLYNLRKTVLTGRAQLDQVPSEFRDWMAQLGSAPALWVGDNLGGNTDRTFWNQMNETLARLVTEPEPTITTRELFTTADIRHIPVRCAFAFTSIGPFFNAPDVLQRSITMRLKAIPEGQKNSGWLDEQLAAGREAWVAEHLVVLRRFLQSVQTNWQPGYRSSHRLRHFEQALLLMGRTLGFDMDPIVKGLSGLINEEIADDNPLISALRDFVDDVQAGQWVLDDRSWWVKLTDLTAWAQDDDRHKNFTAFRSPVMLGKRMREMKSQLEKSVGIQINEKRHNQFMVRIPKPGETIGEQEE